MSVEKLEIVIYPLRPAYLGATQLAMFSASHDLKWRRLQEALRRLKARFGELVLMIASFISQPDPRPIEVRTSPEGLPTILSWIEGSGLFSHTGNRRVYRVQCIYEHWRERRFWWAQPVERDYYRLEDNAGSVRLIYLDLRTAKWWLERRRL